MKIYTIYDNRAKDFWTSIPGKKLWATKGAAKNAVICRTTPEKERYRAADFTKDELSAAWLLRREADKYARFSFADQQRFECREYDLDSVQFTIV